MPWNHLSTRPHRSWRPLSVGCHWINADYPGAIVSTVRSRTASGYVAVLDFNELGVYDTLRLAQIAIEATAAPHGYCYRCEHPLSRIEARDQSHHRTCTVEAR